MNGKLNKFKTEHEIILGDFNCVMDNNLYKISGDPHHTEDVEQLKSFVYDNGFSDKSAFFHEDDKEYSWSRKTPFIARRLDYILCQTVFQRHPSL